MRQLICLVVALVLTATLGAQPRNGPSTGHSSQGTYSLEFEIISLEQIEAYQQGTPPSEIFLTTGETLEELLAPKGSTPTFELTWTAISCGGDMSEATDGEMGDVQVEASCGQPVTGTASGGGFEVDAGVPRAGAGLFADGFESGDTSAWQ